MNHARRIQPNTPQRWLFQLRISWRMLITVAILAVTTSIMLQYRHKLIFPVRDVKVVGATHLDHAALRHSLLPLLKSGFFTLSPSAIRQQIMQFPWVRDASVRRVWPNGLIISVIEHVPAARWKQTRLVSEQGEIFSPAHLPDGLPLLAGPEGSQLKVLNYYRDLSAHVQPLGAKVAALTLMPWHNWQVRLDNGIKLKLSDEESLTRVDHFVKVYAQVVGKRIDEIEYVDLRYVDGFAIRWKAVM